MKLGTVKWFNSRKGYGVIQPFDGGFNVYVNIDAVERARLGELKEGQVVTFDIVPDTRTGEAFAENLSVSVNRQEEVVEPRAAFLVDGLHTRRSNFQSVD